MRVTTRALRSADVAAVRHLVQLYIYDLGGDRWGVEPDGRFGSRGWHRRFWTRHGRHHFVIRADGRLAGSVLTLDVAVRRFAAATGWGWSDLARASAGNAADALGLSTKGRLTAGADADLVLVGDGGAGEVLLTVVEGRIVHRRR